MIALVEFIDEHPEEVEYDLLRSGCRLRDWPDNGVSWRDLFVLLRQADRDTAVYRAVMGDAAERTTDIELLRRIEYLLQIIAAQRTIDLGARGPQLQPMPWDEPTVERPDAMSLAEVYEWMGEEMPAELMN